MNIVDEFRAKNNFALTKAHFFLVFDCVWQEMKIKPNAIGGFRKAGLVPFNPNCVDILSVAKKSAADHSYQSADFVSREKAIGFANAFVIMACRLSSAEKSLFERRLVW